MTNQLDLYPRGPMQEEGAKIIRYGYRLELAGVEHGVVWYDIPQQLQYAVTDRCDPYVIGGLFEAMKFGGIYRIHGAISQSLHAQLMLLHSLQSHCLQ